MADLSEMTPGQVLADSSVAEFIKELGLGVAAAQVALDDNSVRQMEIFTRRREDLGNRSLLDLGLMPAFYHYQHADITCSMQIRMEVGKSDEFGFGARFGMTDTSDSASSSTTSQTTSQSTNRRETRSARLSMRADSTSVFALTGGTQITPSGNTPVERLMDLRNQLLSGDSGIQTLIAEPPNTQPDMSLNSPTDKVVVQSPTVAFRRPDADNALIRITANTATNFVVNGALTINTTAQADIPAYAQHVKDQFATAGYDTNLVTPQTASTVGIFTPMPFATGSHELTTQMANYYAVVASNITAIGLPVEIEGYADLQRYRTGDSDQRNLELGKARARAVWRHLRANGVPDNLLPESGIKSSGTQAARDAGNSEGQDNPDFRVVRVRIMNLTVHYVGAGNAADFDPAQIAPSNIGGGSNANAYVHLYDQQSLSLGGNGVTIDGTSFGFEGTANGASAGAAASYANNLAASINQTSSHRAWAAGNVVTVARAADTFDVRLFSTSSREIRVQQNESFSVTQQFTRSTSAVQQRDRNQNRSIAVGVSVDGRFSRQFNMQVTGNSTISARLVSIPAPPAFLEQIRAFQAGRSE